MLDDTRLAALRWPIPVGRANGGYFGTIVKGDACPRRFAFAFRFIPLEKLGMVVELGAGFVVRAGLLMVPLVMVFAALQTIVAAYAKSYREAQTYLSLLMLLPMIPSVILMINPMKTELWMAGVPLLSQHVLIMSLARAEVVELSRFALSFGATLALAGVLVWIAVRIYHREQLAVST